MTRKIKTSNRNLAQIFAEVGQLLSLKGENQFKVIAYENVSRVIKAYPKELIHVWEEGGVKALEEIEGVGEGIAKKIESLLKTGKLPYYDRLKKNTHPLLLELVSVVGIGPATAKKLVQKLKPANLNDLKKKLDSPLVLKYFSLKQVYNIKRDLKERRHEKRYLLSEVEPLALRLVNWLQQRPEVTAADPVGSLRRRKETIGDIDLVCASKNRKKTVEAFSGAPFAARTIKVGLGQVSIVHESGFQIDLELVPPADYGSLLQHFTGGKDHNVALRTWAQQEKKLSLSEQGIESLRTGKIKRCQTEEQFYRALGMDWIPPELRTNRGEIEAARAHELPKLIELKDIKGDLHLHTTASDGNLTLAKMVEAAYQFGHKYVAITDHSHGAGAGLPDKELLKHRDKIKKLDQRYAKKGMRILAGVEVNIRPDGSLDVADKVLEKLDWVVASVHSSFRQSAPVMTKRILAALDNPFVSCLGHPGTRKLTQRDEIQVDWDKLYEAAARNKVLLEINADPNRLDLKDTRIQAAKEYGVKFVINTDSHRPEHFHYLTYGLAMARRGWLEKSDVLNTKTPRQLATWLKSRIG